MGGRRRRHLPQLRASIIALIQEASESGARLSEAARIVGITAHTHQRWLKQRELVDPAWDITCLPKRTSVDRYFYLYLFIDIWSPRIVAAFAPRVQLRILTHPLENNHTPRGLLQLDGQLGPASSSRMEDRSANTQRGAHNEDKHSGASAVAHDRPLVNGVCSGAFLTWSYAVSGSVVATGG